MFSPVVPLAPPMGRLVRLFSDIDIITEPRRHIWLLGTKIANRLSGGLGSTHKRRRDMKTLPFLSILALIFITLKLTGHLAWSWVWVLAPLWAPLAIAGVIFLIVGALTVRGSK